MQQFKEKLKSILTQYFSYYKYTEAIEQIRELLLSQKITQTQWDGIKSIILEQKFEDGEALSLLALNANLPLDEDTEEEAYKWFNLFINNVESTQKIIEY